MKKNELYFQFFVIKRKRIGTGEMIVMSEEEIRKQRLWHEIRTGYIDENGDIYVDAYTSDDDNEEGKVIAIIHKDGSVTYKDERAKINEHAQEIIQEMMREMDDIDFDKNDRTTVPAGVSVERW